MSIKKISAAVMTAAILAVGAPVMGFSDPMSVVASAENYDYRYEELDDGTLKITDYRGYGGDVVIPNEIDGKKVTVIGAHSIGDRRGYGNVIYKITSITIPEGITTIEYDSFLANNVSSIAIPDSVSLIESLAFRGNGITEINVGKNNKNYSSVDGVLFNKDKTKLLQYPKGKTEKSYEIPNGVVTIGNGSFNMTNNITSVIIPDSVTTIENGAFFNVKGITSIIIPNGVNTIESSAIDLPNLTSVKIPASVTTIGEDAFSGRSLVQITVDTNNKNYCSSDGILFNKDKTELIKYPEAKSNKTYTIPDGVQRICDQAFFANGFITSVTIPRSVYSFGKAAFSSCDSLNSVTIYSRDFGYYYGGFANPFPAGSKVAIFGYKNTKAEEYVNEYGNGNIFIALDAELKNGDANGDGKLDVNDAIIAVQCALGDIKLVGNAFKNADTDGNGEVNVTDVVNIIDLCLNF